LRAAAAISKPKAVVRMKEDAANFERKEKEHTKEHDGEKALGEQKKEEIFARGDERGGGGGVSLIWCGTW